MAVAQIDADRELDELMSVCHQADDESFGFMVYMKIVNYKKKNQKFDMVHCAKWLFNQRIESRQVFLDTEFYMYAKGVLKYRKE